MSAETPTLCLSLEDKMLKTTMLTQARLKEIVHYNKDTGIFTRLHINNARGFNKNLLGKHTGCISEDLYVKIRVDGVSISAHRLAWLYVYGTYPKNELDHIDHDRGNNRISNLREVTHQENMRNQKIPKNSTTGVLGVSYYDGGRKKKWKASIKVDGKTIFLGYFVNLIEAQQARREAECKYGFFKNHGRNM